MKIFIKKIYSRLFGVALAFLVVSCSPKIVSTTNPNTVKNDSIIKSAELLNNKTKTTNNDDYYVKSFIRYEDRTYKENIKTVQLYKEGWPLSSPLIQLDSDEKLFLSFDDLSDNIKTYKYTVIHCDADWKPSDMLKNEYIDGFQDDYISDYGSSFNTLVKYYHYSLSFPTENLRITKSGNYLLKVYTDEDTENNLVLTRRFMVFEQKVGINGKVKRATKIEDQDYKQEVDFEITYPNYNIQDPYSDLSVVITQNDRQDNAIRSLKPKYVKNNILDYDYEDDNVFSGGNEFRRFDIVSVKFISERIHRIFLDSAGYQIYLLPDVRRSFTTYASAMDINGKKLVKTTETVKDPDLEGEYAYIHFTLPYPEPLSNGNLYIFGALTDWQFQKEAIMKYNYQKRAYEGVLFLKQGYYNYQYVFLENTKSVGDETVAEGSHYDTENDYTIYVYNKESGTSYDKLIAVKKLNSIKQE